MAVCFKCGKNGHMAKNCYSSTRNSSVSVQSSKNPIGEKIPNVGKFEKSTNASRLLAFSLNIGSPALNSFYLEIESYANAHQDKLGYDPITRKGADDAFYQFHKNHRQVIMELLKNCDDPCSTLKSYFTKVGGIEVFAMKIVANWLDYKRV